MIRSWGSSIANVAQQHDFSHVPVARSLLQRIVGLIECDRGASFLLIPRCSAVHTWFMRAPIDIVFLDEAAVVVSVRERVRPWRTQVGPSTATAVLELPAGHAQQIGLVVGDFAVL
ncbi:MAG TPA: DUF192 domain-containing protein [Thermoanaerobaculia bacterium]|nr:DUF192 domain-containing protein [Thermoanaerobaculia bacterium]